MADDDAQPKSGEQDIAPQVLPMEEPKQPSFVESVPIAAQDLGTVFETFASECSRILSALQTEIKGALADSSKIKNKLQTDNAQLRQMVSNRETELVKLKSALQVFYQSIGEH